MVNVNGVFEEAQTYVALSLSTERKKCEICIFSVLKVRANQRGWNKIRTYTTATTGIKKNDHLIGKIFIDKVCNECTLNCLMGLICVFTGEMESSSSGE